MKRKPRTPSIHIELRENVQLDWDKDNKCLLLRSSDGTISDKHLVSVGEGYARIGKGDKVLRLIPNPSGGVIKWTPDPPSFDHYLAVDTNYKPFGKGLLCSTACVRISDIQGKITFEKGEKLWLTIPPRLIFWCTQGSKPERYGWMKIVDSLLKSGSYDENSSYALVVDSDLNDLAKINAQEISIIEGFYTPVNVSLLYASTDSGKENLLNKLIGWADIIAAKELDHALFGFRGQEAFDPGREYWDIQLSDIALDEKWPDLGLKSEGAPL